MWNHREKVTTYMNIQKEVINNKRLKEKDPNFINISKNLNKINQSSFTKLSFINLCCSGNNKKMHNILTFYFKYSIKL